MHESGSQFQWLIIAKDTIRAAAKITKTPTLTNSEPIIFVRGHHNMIGVTRCGNQSYYIRAEADIPVTRCGELTL